MGRVIALILIVGGNVAVLVTTLGADLSRSDQVPVILSITCLLMLFLVGIIDPVGTAVKAVKEKREQKIGNRHSED